MLWDDPWIAAATSRGGTRLPPPPCVLPTGCAFRCLSEPTSAWLALVGTRWTVEQATARLVGAQIPVLEVSGDLVATCVLRPQEEGLWILETLRARRGYGSLLLRSTVSWLFQRAGPFRLTYTWELTIGGLAYAWWRGWLASAAEIQYGWMWAGEGCGFCPGAEAGPPIFVVPTLLRSEGWWVVASDSGQRDGWGYILDWSEGVEWGVVAKRGGWRRLWARGAAAPQRDWRWSGECVVIGCLNGQPPTRWITAEIA
jgi:hypothetical protein